eukprot:366056-Chlamydomonas_euryale.AAC.2
MRCGMLDVTRRPTAPVLAPAPSRGSLFAHFAAQNPANNHDLVPSHAVCVRASRRRRRRAPHVGAPCGGAPLQPQGGGRCDGAGPEDRSGVQGGTRGAGAPAPPAAPPPLAAARRQ